MLLQDFLPRRRHFDDFEVDHDFKGLGRRWMVLNARRLPPEGLRPELILLAVEDATGRRGAAASLALSETRYRRLFETAQDDIVLVDPGTGRISDANPFTRDTLGYPRDGLVGKELWEIGLFAGTEANKAAFATLQARGYIRYDDLPLRTHGGRGIEVEFVSNADEVGDARAIQCNVRDVTDRQRAEDALRVVHAELEARVVERAAVLAAANATLKGEIASREAAEAGRRELQLQMTTVQEDERRQIACELHDQMGQHLTALGLGLKFVEDGTPGPITSRSSCGRPRSTTRASTRPWRTTPRAGRASRSTSSAPGRKPPAVEAALDRVTQEALTNVLKEAGAARVSVVLQRSGGLVTAVIEDDGVGFEADRLDGRRRLPRPHRDGQGARRLRAAGRGRRGGRRGVERVGPRSPSRPPPATATRRSPRGSNRASRPWSRTAPARWRSSGCAAGPSSSATPCSRAGSRAADGPQAPRVSGIPRHAATRFPDSTSPISPWTPPQLYQIIAPLACRRLFRRHSPNRPPEVVGEPMNRARPYVLVVDDLLDAADGLADLAALWGYDAEAHYGGPSALAAAAARPPAVVVLDVAMPRMDGFAFVARLRDLPGCVHTAVVVVSGRTGGDSQAHCCRLGIGHYLFKPVDPQVVRRLLASLVADSEVATGRTELPVTPGPEVCGPESCDFLR